MPLKPLPRRHLRVSNSLTLPPRKREEKSMTIVIGMMADSKQSSDPAIPTSCHLLLCADTMASYTTLGGVTITSHQSEGKLYELPHGFFLGFSDDYYWSHLVANEIHGRMLGVDF